jgi:hypothetical protein
LIKDYDCHILYHPGRANVVVDALCRKAREDKTNLVVVIEEQAQQITIVQVLDVLTYETPILAALVVERLAPNKIRLA